MVDLLHEIWEELDDQAISHEVCAVSAEGDERRRTISPESRLVHSFYAASYNSAMQHFNDWRGYGTYKPMDGPDTIYSASDLAKQQRYLRIRNVS
jgi:hypothetical protein